MDINLTIDDNLLIEAQKVGNHKSKEAAVTTALVEYINHQKQQEIVLSFGKIKFDEKHDYKKARKQ